MTFLFQPLWANNILNYDILIVLGLPRHHVPIVVPSTSKEAFRSKEKSKNDKVNIMSASFPNVHCDTVTARPRRQSPDSRISAIKSRLLGVSVNYLLKRFVSGRGRENIKTDKFY